MSNSVEYEIAMDAHREAQEEEEEHEYEYYNYGTEREPRFGEVSYQVAGGGLGNGNAYATVELKDGIYYYCEYGDAASRVPVGNKIVWSDEYRRGEKDPYESRPFDILDDWVTEQRNGKLHGYTRGPKRFLYEALIKDSSNYEELKKKDDEHVIAVLKTFGITVNFMN